jgi:hypothetical protein
MVDVRILESGGSAILVVDYSEGGERIDHGSAARNAEILKTKAGVDAVIVVRADQFWVF